MDLRYLAPLLLLVAALSSAACGVSTATDERGADSAAEGSGDPARTDETTQTAEVVQGGATVTDGVVFITRGGRPGDRSGWMALTKAELEIDGERCLRFGFIRGPGAYLPVWPLGYSLKTKGGNIRVLDERGRLVARVGDEVRAGGGEYGNHGTGGGYEALRRRLGVPGRCTGTFWIITPPVEKIGRG